MKSEADVTKLNAVSNTRGGQSIASSNAFQSLALRSMFWRPGYLETSAWLEHIPFAFWLVEALKPRVLVELGAGHGTSYFAFCQAVERLQVDSQCFGIDSWAEGDAAEQTYSKASRYNEVHYPGFSRLVRSPFDEAAHYFPGGTIDFLHIDGRHTLEAVRHDFELWLPKLSDRSVVLLHGTNVRERNYGVCKLFEELQGKYSAFEFVHGQGLGVIGVGVEQNDLLQRLFDAGEYDNGRHDIREVFSRLGRACADSFTAIQQLGQTEKLNEILEAQKDQIDGFKTAIEKAELELGRRSRELEQVQDKMLALTEQHAIERGQLAERITILQEVRADLKKQIEGLQTRIDAITADLHHRMEEMVRHAQMVESQQQQFGQLNEGLRQRDAAITKLRAESEARQAEINRLAKLDADHLRMFNTATAELQQREAAMAELCAESEARQAEIDRLAKLDADHLRMFNAATAELQQREAAMAELRAESEVRQVEINRLLQQDSDRVHMLDAAMAELLQRDVMMTELRAEAEATQVELNRLQKQDADRLGMLNAAIDALQQYEATIAELRAEGEGLHGVLVQRELELDELRTTRQAELAALHQENQRLRAAHDQEALSQQTRFNAIRAGLRERNNEVERLQLDNSSLSASIQERFEELKALTELHLAAIQEKEQIQSCLASEESERAALQEERAVLQVEKGLLVRKLGERHEELAQLTRFLMEGEQMLAQSKQQVATLRKEFARSQAASTKRLFGKSGKQEKERDLLLMSGFFDREWYLQAYPDVAKNGMDPAEHYLRHGAFEGRDPSPFFSTSAYLAEKGSQLKNGENPLLHHLAQENTDL